MGNAGKGKGKGKKKKVVNETLAKSSGRGGDGGFLPSSSDSFVKVVFVKKSLRFFKLVDNAKQFTPAIVTKSFRFLKVVDNANQLIPATFLNDVLVESLARWREHFPGLEVEHLTAHADPKIPSAECTFAQWGGIILIGLKAEEPNIGLYSQFSTAKVTLLDNKTKFMTLTDMIRKEVETSTMLWRKEHEELEDLISKQALDMEDLRAHIKQLREKLKQLQEAFKHDHEQLELFRHELMSHIARTNHIDRLFILERAKIQFIGLLDKPYPISGQSWKEYFGAFEAQDWSIIFGEQEKDVQKMEGVKKLLSSGSFFANTEFYDLVLEEICDSVFAIEFGKDQTYWVWLLSFISSLTEEDIIQRYSSSLERESRKDIK